MRKGCGGRRQVYLSKKGDWKVRKSIAEGGLRWKAHRGDWEWELSRGKERKWLRSGALQGHEEAEEGRLE